MKNERRRLVIIDCIRRNSGAVAVYFLMLLIEVSVFMVYGILAEPLIYAALLTGVFGAILLGISIMHSLRSAGRRSEALAAIRTDPVLPAPETLADADHQAMITELQRRLARSETEAAAARRDTEDILTAWVHQIKTPIAVMRMALTDLEPRDDMLAREELFRIEQYTEMMLQFIRLGADSNDLVIRSYPLDELIREEIRKFAPFFIRRKLSMRYEGTNLQIITDRKWFGCVLDQLFSNATKYTAKGGISIDIRDDRLYFRDTGIGIAPEDLPRIFEKGYTGLNGRLQKHSSGLGLFLAKSAVDKLGLGLDVESNVGEGTCFILDLTGKIVVSREAKEN